MALTAEQRAFWEEIGFDPLPEGASEEEIKARVVGIQYVFKFDGYEVPSDEDVRAALTTK